MCLRITCHLMSGFVSNDAYSPSIDGILAYALRREQLSPEQFALDVAHYGSLPPVDDLPLAKEEFNGDWWYQCSLPIYDDQAVFSRHIHRRFNAQESESYAPDVKKIETTKGAYKNSRILLQQHITAKIEWHAVGDQVEVEQLLKTIPHVGKRVAAGFGRVRRWEVTQDGDKDKARFYRPLPVEFADLNNITGNVMRWGIKPPAKNNQVTCVVPS